VLVAEYNEINALLARHLMTRLGHRPVMAATGGEAVDASSRDSIGRRRSTSC
jgi:hypothetical protein